jgi:hypothetical protein
MREDAIKKACEKGRAAGGPTPPRSQGLFRPNNFETFDELIAYRDQAK